jgi:hypothetical protein
MNTQNLAETRPNDRLDGGTKSGQHTGRIVLAGFTDEGAGAGGYRITGDETENGGFLTLNLGRLSLGIGGGFSSSQDVDIFAFFGVEARKGINVAEKSVVFGYSGDLVGSGGAYLGDITAAGYEFGALGTDVYVMGGKESVTTIHPLDAINSALSDAFSDTYKSIVGPLADPTNFSDPTTQPTSPVNDLTSP